MPSLPAGLDPMLPVPVANPLTTEKVELGKRLFFETRLSRDGTTSCSTCHEPRRAFTDGRPLPIGNGGARGRRNAPTLLNRAYARSLFWDGRAGSLEQQALAPMVNSLELANTYDEIIRRLGSDDRYRTLVRRAFGDAEVTVDRVARALASFERTLVSGGSAFDRYQFEGDETALSESARRGYELFRGRGRCSFCHHGRLFTDDRFHNTGVGWKDPPRDLGRYEVSARDDDRGRFRTPTLRDVEHTAPYMHDGSLTTLEEVIDFYNRGGTPNPYLDGDIEPLGLAAQQRADLVAFLESLSGSS